MLLASPGCYENPVPLQDQLEADTGSCSGEYEDTDFLFREMEELGSKDWDLLFTIHSGWLVRLIQLTFKATFYFQLFRCNSGFDTGLILRFYYDVTRVHCDVTGVLLGSRSPQFFFSKLF